MKTVFRIRMKDGYSTGGMTPGVSKKGKTWQTRAALSNHISLAHASCYKDAVIEEYEVVETLKSTTSVAEYSAALEVRRSVSKAKEAKRIAEAQAERALKALQNAQLAYDKAVGK